jgi:hypothetical protein
MIGEVILAGVRILVLVVIVGVIGYVIYDNVIASDPPKKSQTAWAPSLPSVGDIATVNAGTVGCPVVDDVLKVRDLLRAHTDRQPASAYAVEHRCVVLARAQDYRIEAVSAGRNTACLQVPGQRQCQWAPLDLLKTRPGPAAR